MSKKSPAKGDFSWAPAFDDDRLRFTTDTGSLQAPNHVPFSIFCSGLPPNVGLKQQASKGKKAAVPSVGVGAPEQHFAFATAHDGDIAASSVINAMLEAEDKQHQQISGKRPASAEPGPRKDKKQAAATATATVTGSAAVSLAPPALDGLTHDGVNNFFNLRDTNNNFIPVKDKEIEKIIKLHNEFHFMADQGIARLEVDTNGDNSVFKFKTWHVLQHTAWDKRMLALAGVISPRSINANEPVACIYEIIKYCGMEVMFPNKKPQMKGQKKSLKQDAYVFHQKLFDTNKKRVNDSRSKA